MTEAEAIAALQAFNTDGASLTWSITRSYSGSVSVGDVISMDPPADALVSPTQHVIITVSLGAFAYQASRWAGVPDPITGLTPAQAVALSTSVVMSVFVDLDIVGDRQRLCDAGATINWGGYDWFGLGLFGGIDAIVESLEVLAQPVKLTLSGVEAQYKTDAMTTQYRGRDVTIYVGLLNPNTYALIDTPEEVWSGYMDVMTIEVDQGMATITVDCEHRLRRQPASSRYTDEDQRARYPADVFFNALHLIPGYVGKWGAKDVTHRGSGGGSGSGRLGGSGGGRLL